MKALFLGAMMISNSKDGLGRIHWKATLRVFGRSTTFKTIITKLTDPKYCLCPNINTAISDPCRKEEEAKGILVFTM